MLPASLLPVEYWSCMPVAEIPFLADLREELERLRVRDELIRSTP